MSNILRETLHSSHPYPPWLCEILHLHYEPTDRTLHSNYTWMYPTSVKSDVSAARTRLAPYVGAISGRQSLRQ